MKVIAKTAITIVETSDWTEVSQESLSRAGSAAGLSGAGAGCSVRDSGGVFIQPVRGREDKGECARALAQPRAAPLASWLKRMRVPHIQARRRCAAKYALPR